MMRRITTALLAMALAGLLMAACGGGDDDDNGGPASLDDGAAQDDSEGDDSEGEGSEGQEGPSQEEVDAALEYAQCMRDHGVDMEDPDFSEGGIGIGIDMDEAGVTEDQLRAAEEECQPILEDAMPEREPLDPEEIAERQDSAVALAQCMRDRGWDMPDPQVDERGGIAIENPTDVGGPGDPNFERFEDDMAECHEEAGMGPPPGGGGDGNTNVNGSEEDEG